MVNEGSFLKNFGKRMQKMRKDKGLTQDDIAMETGIARNFISQIENGHANPSVYTVNRILNHLGKKWKDLD